jgi:hypothetical protein
MVIYSEDVLGDWLCLMFQRLNIRDCCEECYVNVPDSYSTDLMVNSGCSHIVSYVLSQYEPFGNS